MTKVNFLNQAESFMSESCISQLHGNAHKPEKVDTLFWESWKEFGKMSEQGFLKGSRKWIV